MLNRYSRCDLARRFYGQHCQRRLAPVCHHQREVLIERIKIAGYTVTGDDGRPHAYRKRPGRSGREPDTLDIVREVLLAARSRVLSREMVSIVHRTTDDDFEVELVHVGRICRRVSGRISPY